MADDNTTTVTLSADDGDQVVRLPDGWRFPGTQVRLRRVGAGVMLEPVLPPAPPGWPAGYWEWLEEARALGDFGDFDLEEIEMRGLRLQDVNLDDADADAPE